MESIHSQADMGIRTADFFEDSSEDETVNAISPENIAPDGDLLLDERGLVTRKRHTAPTAEPLASHCEEKRGTFPPDREGYRRVTPSSAYLADDRGGDTSSSSFNGSVDELLPEHRSSPPQFPRAAHIQSGRTPRSFAQIEPQTDRETLAPPAKTDQTLGAYAIAHEITLHALMRDEEALDRSLQSFALAPLQAGDRRSLLPDSLRSHDPRSPRAHEFSSPSSAHKRIHVFPPPIDTSAPRKSIPQDIVRTPYPFGHVNRKDFGQSNPPSASVSTPTSATESILTLSIRRSNSNSNRRVASLTIPASNEFSAVRSNSLGAKERHFKALDFDDAEFFRQLRLQYHYLSGITRFLSARSLSRIVVSGPASKAADAGYGWLHQPRSPRVLAYKGLIDTFSEGKILQHYRRPALGRFRYAFVHWAHRLAAAPPVRTPQADDDAEAPDRELVRRIEQPEGLEFVVSWSAARILLVISIVLVVSIVAALLWIFLGHSTASAWPTHGGYRDSGDRVTAGVVMGICILLIGLSGIAGWLGVSWLVM